jgi:hypothetical protein
VGDRGLEAFGIDLSTGVVREQNARERYESE